MRLCQRLLKNEIQCRKHELHGSSLLAPAGPLANPMNPWKGPRMRNWYMDHTQGPTLKSYLQSTTFTKTALPSFPQKSHT